MGDRNQSKSPSLRQVAEPVGQAVRATVGAVDATVGVLSSAVGLSKRRRLPRRQARPGAVPGAVPGLNPRELAAEVRTAPGPVQVTCIDFGRDVAQRQAVTDVAEFLAQPRPAGARVRWINVDGVGDGAVLAALAEHYRLHPLAMEDVVHVHQRPKAEVYATEADGPRTVYVAARMLRLVEDRAVSEQVSIFLQDGVVLTFQEQPGDVWEPLRQRIERAGSRLRAHDASFLLYALLDALVDHIFPVIETCADRLDRLEDRILEPRPRGSIVEQVHAVRRELMLLRREIWPMRELIDTLHQDDEEALSETTRVYLRDVADHVVQAIELLEAYHEAAAGLGDTYMTIVNHRMNDVMKTLTMIATIFIPLTFIAGIYGMNFEHMPELEVWWAYGAIWGVFIGLPLGMVAWFRRKGWW